MRLLHIFNNDRDARLFSEFLTKEGIENTLDVQKSTDWGSDDYGTLTSKLWITEEDEMDAANQWLELFLSDSGHARFNQAKEKIVLKTSKPSVRIKPKFSPKAASATKGTLSLILIAFCTLLFFLSNITQPAYAKIPSQLPTSPLFSSPIKKGFLYDFPLAFTLTEKLASTYGVDKLLDPNQLPQEGKLLYLKIIDTPFWQGFYNQFIQVLKTPDASLALNAPLFEKLHEGEAWRLITPVFLHNDIFHLFFNMIWLLVLGSQIERVLGLGRYTLFIVLTAIFSNTAQYLMSGPNFIGFSGVLCAMIAFVWVRQKKAPWEGYQLLSSTMTFITIFILAMAGIQTISFALQVLGQEPFAPPIANTAHLTGALAGYILAQFNFFAWKGNR